MIKETCLQISATAASLRSLKRTLFSSNMLRPFASMETMSGPNSFTLQHHRVSGMPSSSQWCSAMRSTSVAALDRLDMEQLDQQNILLFHQDSVQNRILMQRFEHLHIQPRIIMHSSQLMTVLKFLRRGNCGCFLFKSMLPMVPELVSIPLSTPIPVRAGLIWKQGRHLNKGMQCFVDFCREHFPISRARS